MLPTSEAAKSLQSYEFMKIRTRDTFISLLFIAAVCLANTSKRSMTTVQHMGSFIVSDPERSTRDCSSVNTGYAFAVQTLQHLPDGVA